MTVCVTQADQAIAISDLCEFLNGHEQASSAAQNWSRLRHRSGSMTSSSGKSVHFFSKPEPVLAKSSIRLSDFYDQRNTLSNKDRVRLALMLAWGVLQISCTSWLEGNWTRENILLVLDASNRPLPYISHRFKSCRKSATSDSSLTSKANPSETWINNISMFALCVFLIEVCHNRPIEDLATNDEKQENGSPGPWTPLLTVMRLSKLVQDELGIQYARAVNACLELARGEVDGNGKPKDTAQFAKLLMRDIINPLKATSETFGE